MKSTDLAWAAGFFDGEGSVSIMLQQRKWPYLQVSVTNKDLRGLQRLEFLFGGHYYPMKRRNGNKMHAGRWIAGSAIGASFLRKIRPYSIQKIEVVDLAIAFTATLQKPHSPVPAGALQDRMLIRRMIMRLNKRT